MQVCNILSNCLHSTQQKRIYEDMHVCFFANLCLLPQQSAVAAEVLFVVMFIKSALPSIQVVQY